jgi:hypothetical protein
MAKLDWVAELQCSLELALAASSQGAACMYRVLQAAPAGMFSKDSRSGECWFPRALMNVQLPLVPTAQVTLAHRWSLCAVAAAIVATTMVHRHCVRSGLAGATTVLLLCC